MFLEAEMKKETRFKHGGKMDLRLNLGKLFTSVMLKSIKRKDSTRTVDFMSTGHSISFLKCIWREL